MKRFTALALTAAAVMVAGCQTFGSRSPIDGSWASDDGVFIASFRDGQFQSTLTATGEAATGGGRYESAGSVVQLTWISVATGERRLATCSFLTPDRLSCAPSVGNTFTLSRIS